jgi:hypothetical protein
MPFVQNKIGNSNESVEVRYSAPSRDPIGLPSENRPSMDGIEGPFAIAFEESSKRALFPGLAAASTAARSIFDDRKPLTYRRAPLKPHSPSRLTSPLKGEPNCSAVRRPINLFPCPSTRGRTPDSSQASCRPPRNPLETSRRGDPPASGLANPE